MNTYIQVGSVPESAPLEASEVSRVDLMNSDETVAITLTPEGGGSVHVMEPTLTELVALLFMVGLIGYGIHTFRRRPR